jgi:RHS repeat-associated protein
VGNRLSQTVNGATTTYSYNTLDQLTTDGMNTYSYDGRGNLTGLASTTGAVTYSYDAADRLTGALNNGTSVSFGYDADGRRVSLTTAGQTVNYLWDTQSTYGDVIQESDGNNAVLASYVLGNGKLISQTRGGNTSFYLQDAQNNVRTLTDASGTLTDKYNYTAFGTVTHQSGSNTNPYLFADQQLDTTTGLYDMRARYYDPGTGRFLNRDTAEIHVSDPVEINRYLYTADNPVNGAVGEPCDGSHTNH